MKPANLFRLVLVTAPDLKIARKLARTALKAHLAACVNLVSKMESHYCWQGKMEAGDEVMMLIKTSREKLAALEKLILANHPYDTPEFLVLNLSQGNERYLDWLAESVA